ncbi:unnamed protein product, partial [Rotaria magnacalcarata]
VTNEYLVGVCLKLFCSICYENDAVARQLQTTVFTQTNETLCEIISSLLNKTNQPVVLSCDDSFISHKSLTTLVHLCTKSTINKSIHLYIACFDTLIYLLNGNSTLHHTAMYTEQFLNKLFCYLFAPTKIFNEIIDEAMLIQIRTSTLTLLAVLSSYHEDIKKRIADQD